MNKPYIPIKRAFDFTFACLCALALWPVALAAMVAVLIEDWSAPPIFVQERVGKHEKPFQLYKIRTMRCARDGHPQDDDARMLRTGQWLRRTSIDELPQIWNILKGDMSFIGPRPWLPNLLPYYAKRERKRHDVAPGLSGLAQVNGRNTVDFVKRMEYDIAYVENVSLALDARIFLKTLHYVLFASHHVLTVSETRALYDHDLAGMRRMESTARHEPQKETL